MHGLRTAVGFGLTLSCMYGIYFDRIFSIALPCLPLPRGGPFSPSQCRCHFPVISVVCFLFSDEPTSFIRIGYRSMGSLTVDKPLKKMLLPLPTLPATINCL